MNFLHYQKTEKEEVPLPEDLERRSAMLDGLTIGATLSPSLKSDCRMGRMRSHGMPGNIEF
jgi:hypothetical protein